jgi:hypothetical protein
LYFSGFCLANEKELFDKYIIQNDFTVNGFSYGAIKAFEYTLKLLKNNKRVDKLQLFSPAYFENKDTRYKRLQLFFYKKNVIKYRNIFLKNIIDPSNRNLEKYIISGTYKELDILINYIWNKKDLKYLVKQNVNIEVFLGNEDKIINSNIAKDFFREFAEVYYIKNVGHILN